MTRRRVGAVLAAALALSACIGGSDGPPPSPIPATNAIEAPLLPTATNALPFMDVDGFHALLRQLRGVPVVVNVWASWCIPCKAEAPLLREAASKYGEQVQFLGVDIEDARSSAEDFIADHDYPYPSVLDPTGAIRDSLGSIGQPVTAFFAADGSRSALWDGQLSAGVLEENVQRLVS